VNESASGESIRFALDSNAGLQVAIANVKSLSLLRDFSPDDLGLIAVVVAELGSNILKYAGKGSVTLSRIDAPGRYGVEVIAKDSGPGIRDPERAMEERYSTAGTLGLGLPAVRRIMSTLEIETQVAQGTTVIARKWLEKSQGGSYATGSRSTERPPAASIPEPASRRVGTAPDGGMLELSFAQQVRPHPAESHSGDITAVVPLDSALLFGVIDVSGHGYEAHRLARRLAAEIETNASLDLVATLQALHMKASGTRGAAVGLAVVDRARRRLQFAGVGNGHIRYFGSRHWRGVWRDGIVGERLPTVVPQSIPLEPGDLIVMASDGVSESRPVSELRKGSPLSAEHIARCVIRQAGRNTDDASCIVVKCRL
jgi:anti-sigma regulatory factor (Ser/Thr protein kinase)